MDDATFSHSITCCYIEIVHWRRNLFKIPSFMVDSQIVCKMAKLFKLYANGYAIKSIALKAAMMMLALLFEKASKTLKTRDHVAHLEHHLEL